MRVYVASAYSNKDAAEAFARELEADCHVVTSTWHRDGLSREIAAQIEADYRAGSVVAELCFDQIDDADAVVLLADVPMRGGAFVEYGYAHGKGKPLFVVGDWQRLTPMVRPPFAVVRPTTDLARDALAGRA